LSEENVDGVNVGHEHEAFMMGTLLLLTRDTQHNAATQLAVIGAEEHNAATSVCIVGLV
jgi:hypothetical protein